MNKNEAKNHILKLIEEQGGKSTSKEDLRKIGDTNWKNRTIFTGDNLHIMRGMNSNSVDLIYLDPPFNSNRDYEAPVGSSAEGAEFKDTWTLDDIDISYLLSIKDNNKNEYVLVEHAICNHSRAMGSYILYMGQRLREMKRILKPTGSIYLHCDPTASHYLKGLMDLIFGAKNFRNEIIWHYPNRLSQKGFPFPKLHDTILCYSYSDNFVKKELIDKNWVPSKAQQRRVKKGWEFYKGTLVVYNESKAKADGKDLSGKSYKVSFGKTGRKRINSVWVMDQIASTAKERVGYPTQKPLALLKRIIQASSNEKDTVFDPFCGCATACVAAEELGREWVGIDFGPKTYNIIQKRMDDNEKIIYDYKITNRKDIPKRTDLGKLPKYNSPENKKALYGIQEGNCNGCKAHFPSKRNLTVDHIVPKSKGGTDHLSNLQLLCGSCNSTKGDRTHEWLITRLEKENQIVK